MKIELSKVWHQEEERRIVTTVVYSEEQPDGTWNSLKLDVFIPWTDSYAEMKRQALEKAKEFLAHCASSH